MKKIVLVLLCLFMASAAFSIDKAAGFGVFGGAGFTSGDVKNFSDASWEMNRGSFGVFGFLGLSQYLELNFGYLYKSVDSVKATVSGQSVTYSGSETGIESTSALQLGAYGKYPIPLSDKLVFFPTGGADFELTISDNEGWWSDVWIRGGAGLDFFFTDTMFLRGHLLYGAAIPVAIDNEVITPKITHGPLVKVGLGWMF